ncbi:MAG: hypothetical protein ACI9KK_000386 [Ascidiaceihabitans sp.]
MVLVTAPYVANLAQQAGQVWILFRYIIANINLIMDSFRNPYSGQNLTPINIADDKDIDPKWRSDMTNCKYYLGVSEPFLDLGLVTLRAAKNEPVL